MPVTTACSAGRLRRVAGAALVLLVVSFGVTWLQVPAQGVGPSSSEEGSEEAGQTGRMVLVLDSSGSMKERSSGGQTKIAAAKKALNQVIGSLAEDQSVGLRVYGAKVFSRDQAGACTDSQLVVPVDTGNRDQLRKAVAGYRPYGETPIGYALQQAGKDLGGEGKRTIVLVSDGEPTCDPDPCKVARDLSKQGVNLKVDVVGLDVDGAARQKLQCIAGAGNGTYYDVDSSEEFAASLEKLATRAARPFTTIGAPVTGTPTDDGAPTITAGDWVDELGTSEETLTRHYVVEREIPGSTLHVSASLRTASSSGENVDVTLTAPDGTQCAFDTAFTQLSTGKLISAGAAADNLDAFGEPAEGDPCASEDAVSLTVVNGATEVAPRPLEIRVIEEPPVTQIDSLPEAADDADWTEPATGGSAQRTTGGASFVDAPLLEPGSYRDAIVPGEVLTYQVDVGWGQQLSALVDFPRTSAKLNAAVGMLEMNAGVDVFGPSRRLAKQTATGAPPPEGFLPADGFQIATTTSPVRYLNRGSQGAASGAALAGRYTVTVFLESDPDGESYVVPFTLDLAVTGDVAGEPTYSEAPADPESQAPATNDEERAGGSDNGRERASDDLGGGLSAGYVVGGLGLVAMLAAGYVVLRSRTT